MTSDLWRVAVRASIGGGTWPDEAIEAAIALLVAGDARSEVMEVAVMPPGISSADARAAVEALLRIEGIPVIGLDGADSARLPLIAGAFVHGGVSADEFGRSWWGGQLPSYDEQTEEQITVTAALDAWESEPDLAARAHVADALRAAVAAWLASPAPD